MSDKRSIKDVIHIFKSQQDIRIYEKKGGYTIWHRGYNWRNHVSNGSNYSGNLYTAREIHKLFNLLTKGGPAWNDIIKKQTNAVSRRIVRDAVKHEEFDKIPQKGIPYKEDPWNYD